MVMKRYPNGIDGEYFFMKRAPQPRPRTIPICSIKHGSGNVIGFPVIQHLASLLWAMNLGCIDLNPWYARCDDVYRPDYPHFDLDPVAGTPFERVLETALLVRDALAALKINS
jgi:bifunctional non-homologous end joining protein LigD